MLDGSLHNHALEDLTRIHLDRAAPALADVLGSGRNKVSVDAVSPEALRDTAAAHADLSPCASTGSFGRGWSPTGSPRSSSGSSAR